MESGFELRWKTEFGLSDAQWRTKAKAHLETLPFSESKDTWPLIEALFTTVSNLVEKTPAPETELLAEAFAKCCFAFWQCGSAFPAFPENYAEFLLQEISKPPGNRDAHALILARMINGSEGGRCGFNHWKLADPATIRESERRIHEGGYEFYLRAEEKYREFDSYLKNSSEFKQEWIAFKQAFPGETTGPGIVRRSLLVERNWIQTSGAGFAKGQERFQALFDLFCWKYFLWGMKGDKPLLMKPSVVFTPLGTQIFIPGYLSLDGKRDLKFSQISKIHRARGITRQGTKFSSGRLDAAGRNKLAKEFDLEARMKGLKGEERFVYILTKLGKPLSTDHREVRKWLGK